MDTNGLEWTRMKTSKWAAAESGPVKPSQTQSNQIKFHENEGVAIQGSRNMETTDEHGWTQMGREKGLVPPHFRNPSLGGQITRRSSFIFIRVHPCPSVVKTRFNCIDSSSPVKPNQGESR